MRDARTRLQLEAMTSTAPPTTTPTDAVDLSHRKLAIIGSGPAGLTAALYAARANLEPIVFAGNAPLGQLMITSDVENYPGFPDGILGPELMDLFRRQAERFGAILVEEDVTKVDFSERPFKLWVRENLYLADAVVVATGASALWLGLPSEEAYRGRGVSACATCDGFFFRDREVAEVLGNTTVERLRLRDTQSGDEEGLDAQGLFIAIGYKPNTDLFAGQLDLDARGYCEVTGRGPGETSSNIEGVFVAGDVHDHTYRQAVTAAGEGCKAAIDAERWLESIGEHVATTATNW